MIRETKEIEMFVELIIPDTAAITALHTLGRMGYRKLKKLRRISYYKFYFQGDEKKFKEEMGKVDILVNVNKHRHSFNFLDNDDQYTNIKILVKDIEDKSANSLLSTLRNRLGFKNIEKVEKGTLWILSFNLRSKEVAESIAREAAEKLLYNKHYQEMKLL